MWSGIKFGVAAVLAVSLMLVLTKQIERTFFHVFTEIELVQVKETDLYVDLLLRGVKSRSCLIVSASVDVKQAGSHVIVTPVMLREDGSVLKADDQRIDVGTRFVRVVRVPAIGTITQINVTSRCHPLWLTEQVLVNQ